MVPVINQPIVFFRLLLVVLAQIRQTFCVWPSVPSESVAQMFYLLLYALFAIKTDHYGHDIHFYHETKRKAADKTLL